MNKRCRQWLMIGAAVALAPAALAEPLVTYETAGLAGEVAELEPDGFLPGLSATAVMRGAGLAVSSLSDAFASTGFNAGVANTLADAIAAGEYLEFAVAPAAGFTLSLTSLEVNLRRTSTGPSTFEWRYSFDSFVTGGTQVATFTYASTEPNGAAQAPVNLSAVDDLQAVGFGETVTFRLYGAGATSGLGSLAIGRLSGADLSLSGTLSPVPEPQTYALWAGGAALGLGGWFRRQRRKRALPDIGEP